MIPVPNGVKVWLAPVHTDMRKGFPGLSMMVQEALKRDPTQAMIDRYDDVPSLESFAGYDPRPEQSEERRR